MQMLAVASYSIRKSLSETVSRLLALTVLKPKVWATHAPVDGVGHARERACAQGQHIHAAVAVAESLFVPLQHLDVGQEVVSQEHRLRPLQVCVAGQDGLLVLLC